MFKNLILTLALFIVYGSLFAGELYGETTKFNQMTVRNIVFSGNGFISDRELLQHINTKTNSLFSQQSIINDSELIAEYYKKKGFEMVKVLYPEAIPINPHQVDVYIQIEELHPLLIKKIILVNNSYISTERIFQNIGISSTGRYSLNDLNNIILQIVDLYTSRGFLFAEVTRDSLNVIEYEKLQNSEVALEIYLSINEGNICRFNKFIIEGNKVTKDETIMRLTGLNRPGIYTLDRLRQAEENVRRKEYVKDFSIYPVDSETLLMQIEEDKMTYISGMIGYDSLEDKATDRLTGFINLKLYNLYGTNRSLTFLWQKLQISRQSVEFRYSEPGLFDFPIAGELLLYRETVDSSLIRTTIDSEIYYYGLRNKYGLYMGADNIYPGSRRPEVVQKKSYKKIGFFWNYNSEDYYYNPTKGMKASVKHYYIINRTNSKWVDKQATEMSWTNYFSGTNGNFSKPIVVMFSLNGKQIQNKDLQDYEYYNLGGIKNVRGFRENQFTGYRILWSNLEFRYLLSRNSRLFLFADYGYVEMNDEENRLNDLVGLGFGFRFDTRLGMLGVDYGFSHSEGEWLHPLDGMIHFGIETKF